MTKTLIGTVRGKLIELHEDPGLSTGQKVEVRLTTLSTEHEWGHGLRRCAGALADSWTEEDDRVLEQIRAERKADRRREVAP